MEAFVITVPALRQRREDIGVLLLHALQACTHDAGELAAFPAALVSQMCNYDWPGNIRQLVNVTRRAVMAQRAGEVPQLSHFVQAAAAAPLKPPLPHLPQLPQLPPLSPLPASASNAPPASARRSLSAIGEDALLDAMEDNGWQISGAAQQLGISRPSLYKLIEAHPAIRAPALIEPAEIAAALSAHGNDAVRCAAALKTPSEALRRHLRVLGLDARAA
jgi:two-component system nitrogen regulation response regulator GlnG